MATSSRRSTSTMTNKNFKRTLRQCVAVWGLAVVFTVLASIDISTATSSPAAHNHHHRQASNSNSNSDSNANYRCSSNFHGDGNGNVETLRGGSTILQPPPPPPPLQEEQHESQSQQQSQQQQFEQQLQQHSHQLQQHSQQHQLQLQQQQHGPPEHQRVEEHHHQEQVSWVPTIDLGQVARALSHTSGLNRKLRKGVKYWGKYLRQRLEDVPYPEKNHLPVNVHPSRSWQPPIQAFSGRLFEEEELSLFHAKIPRDTHGTGGMSVGVANNEVVADHEDTDWGPDLLPYLEHIVEMLDMDPSGVEIVLAMIYLDRACSVETPRGGGGGVSVSHGVSVPPCPFCEPRTVHRLSLAALVVAFGATSVRSNGDVEGGNDHEILVKLSLSLGIPLVQLEQMVEWMQASLGDDGTYVGREQMQSWSRSWGSFFAAAEAAN